MRLVSWQPREGAMAEALARRGERQDSAGRAYGGGPWRLGVVLAGGETLVDAAGAVRWANTAGLADPPGDILAWLDLDAPWLGALARAVDAAARDDAAAAALRREGLARPVTGATLGPPVPRPGKIVCVGLNYRDHAAEARLPVPDSPVIFAKFPSAVVGPGAPILLPRGSDRVDYEAELAVVIGRRAKHVPRERALETVVGYMNANDVSARDFQKLDGQWVRAKSCDTFAPMGPWLVTRDEAGDPNALAIRLRLNGVTMQDSSTREFVFDVATLVAFLSETMTLEPGDVVLTGTPPGVGFARHPPVYLRPGDVVEVEIEGLGVLRNEVRAEA
jgi:2-keto-4-pentenoate hydratase/2-oxohepta-3-ene-1,7-dioic acid hydratase in catechol pathway